MSTTPTADIPESLFPLVIEATAPRIIIRDGVPLLIVTMNGRSFSIANDPALFREGLAELSPHFEIVSPDPSVKPHYASGEPILTLTRAFENMAAAGTAQPGPLTADQILAAAKAPRAAAESQTPRISEK